MKNVPKLRFKEFTDEWEEKKLNNILKIGNGKDYKNLGKGSIPVYGTGGIIEKINTYLYDGETIFIGRKGTINKPVYFNGKFWTVDTLFYTYDFKNNCVKFIYYVFNNIEWLSYNEATGVPSLSKTTILKIKKFFPFLQEQQKIADFLSGVDTKISLTEEKLENLKIYKKGIMQKIFSQEIRFKGKNGNDYPEWEEKKLGDLLENIIDNRGKTPPNIDDNSLVPLLEINSIGNKNIKYKKVTKYVSEETYNTWFRNHIIENDILFSTVGATALCSIYKNEEKAVIAQNLVGLRFKKDNVSDYMYYVITETKNNLKFKSIEMIAVQPSIKVSQMINLKFNVSISLEEQQKIADFLSSIDNKIEKTENKLNELKEFKKGLLQKMFV